MSIKKTFVTVREKATRAALWPAVWLASSPAWAQASGNGQQTTSSGKIGNLDLPSPPNAMKDVATGTWIGDMGGWFYTGILVLGMILVGLAFIYVLAGALGKWRMYARGQADISDLKEYFIMGTILAVFVVAMATYALKAVGGT